MEKTEGVTKAPSQGLWSVEEIRQQWEKIAGA
jgi:hypothetical protein